MTHDSIKYTDETDKSFGLAGMAISLMVWDAETLLDHIDIDSGPDSAMHMAPEFYLSPTVSAKAMWTHNLRRFEIVSAMLVANVACRHLVNRHVGSLPADVDSALRRFIIEEGESLCQLQEDESLRAYSKAMNYCRRLFTHNAVASMASQFSQLILERRRLSSSEIFQFLEPLARM